MKAAAPRKGKWSAGYGFWTIQWTRQRGQDAALKLREGCSREMQAAGTQISCSEGKNVFLRSQKRLRKVFGKSVKFELDSKVGGKFSYPEKGDGWHRGYFVLILFLKSAFS